MLLLITLKHLLRAVVRGWTDPEFRLMLTTVAILIVAGTIFYTRVEGWSVLDSFYFVVITMTTVGYGDLAPTTTGSRMITAFFVVMGIGLFLAFVTRAATFAVRSATESRQISQEKREAKKAAKKEASLADRMAAAPHNGSSPRRWKRVRRWQGKKGRQT